MQSILTQETIIIALIYLSLSVLYLLVIPAVIYYYLNTRWYVASSWERGFMYFLMSFFFPGMLLLSPFLNFRPQRRTLKA
ncbi:MULTISPECIES: NAD(P)H-quinone oxidoreductase subunit L [Microcystis]|jgi:NAD(P)H-quinone oxidoreductase subunit L|uniref:NAD(P)H-quinone oxidoreductase subunit L n=52 Tax=Microcystis TaxID=1125 RepID=NDHL_MICAN|nr:MULTISPECIES: NAD(P)H-quinone oxidoreductase subunit L [Microcystis]B0JWY5.1 RecName: Full=NAD(P)H-quinone oxidoreductase subunit L; AltName: Full=NAD(P)H dehydrogenase I subunit L; AltName: Full=NDH-1 subunit L; AltName: Full=NDH-L [Microcystis aeruginosa NIES-843]MBE5230804.1 NAD(P)H-quinone oxidoreductase subunit L [Microcystis aeruginosa PMC 728.11]MCA2539474.1 NAD(P)H-quinone oxidoreductase subunit L [Microcystis sp. M54BS1]MCA2554081.1 NAD(P)H-quinone oxidoreductase subunit L [Microcys